MKQTSEQLIRDIQSVMDQYITVSINYKNISITLINPVRGHTKLSMPIPYEIPITVELFGSTISHILNKSWELWLDVYSPNDWEESDASCPKGESYRERHYIDIDYLTMNYGTEGQITSHMDARELLHAQSENLDADLVKTEVFKELREKYSHRIKISEEITNG